MKSMENPVCKMQRKLSLTALADGLSYVLHPSQHLKPIGCKVPLPRPPKPQETKSCTPNLSRNLRLEVAKCCTCRARAKPFKNQGCQIFGLLPKVKVNRCQCHLEIEEPLCLPQNLKLLFLKRCISLGMSYRRKAAECLPS